MYNHLSFKHYVTNAILNKEWIYDEQNGNFFDLQKRFYENVWQSQ